MSRRVRRVTPNSLKRMIVEEARKLRKEVLETGKEDPEKVAAATDEVEADEFADSIEQDIDWMKALKIHERRLVRKLQEVKKTRQKLSRRISRKI